MRALVVEDQRQMRAIVRKMLQQMKYFQIVDEAEDGEKAWFRINESSSGHGPYSIVVCDVTMPVLDGTGLLKKCREHPEHRFLPFIMISASSQSATVVSSLGEWGAYDFIVKPFSFELLQQRVAGIMRRIQSPEETLYRQAEELMQNGSVEDALKLIEHWERESRLSRAKWLNLKGECLIKAGDEENAVTHFENAMGVSNIFVKAYKNFAAVNQKLGHLDKAIKALRYVEELSPTDTERTLVLGRLLLQAGQEQEGKKYLDALVKRSTMSDKEPALKRVAELYLEGGLFKEAEEIYTVTLSYNPGDIETTNRLGIALRQQGKYQEAERVYLNALKTHPRHAGLYNNLGVLFMAQKDYEKADRCLRKALELDPELEAAQSILENLKRKMRNKPQTTRS